MAFFIILIVGTGALTYYLIHTAKNDYDKQYNDIISNLPNSNIIVDEEEENVVPISNIIDSAISDVTNQTDNSKITTEAVDTRKILNEELVVLYNGLILDTTKMDEVKLQYIDNTNEKSDKYVITYYNYENYSYKYYLVVKGGVVYANGIFVSTICSKDQAKIIKPSLKEWKQYQENQIEMN